MWTERKNGNNMGMIKLATKLLFYDIGLFVLQDHSQSYRPPALVNLSVNLQLYLHVKKKVHLKLHANLQMRNTFM